MARLVLHRNDGTVQEIDYDALMLPDSYIKIMAGDRVTCIHESLVPTLTLHDATSDDFQSLD